MSADLSRLLGSIAPRASVEAVAPRARIPEFAEVFRQHFDFVWRTLRSLGVPESGVDDAVQDVFISVHRRLPEFEGRAALKTWIYSIAYHTAQNHRRSARRRETLPLEQDAELASGEPGPDERAAGARAGRFVLRFLETLPPERRDVFVLCVLEELSAPDVAAILRVGVNTVYSRLRLGRQQFRQALERLARDERAGEAT